MINNDIDDIKVSGSSKADEIENTGSGVTIDAGAGNDTITNDDGDYSLIQGKDGNDEIYGIENDYVTVDGGSGNDTISGVFLSSEIKGASGNDVMEMELAEDSTLDGGDGADEISGVFSMSSINGGTGNDIIKLQMNDEIESADNTITGGKGNDTIINEVAEEYENPEDVPGNVYQYASGDGIDVVTGFGVNDTLQITSGTIADSLIDDEGNVVFKIGSGSIKLENVTSESIWLQIGKKDAEEISVIPPVEPDYIELTSGKDNYENARDNVTIAALGGNDTLSNNGAEVSINGGAGNDVITNDGDDVTVTGGAGNDTISNSGSGFVYEYEGGKDVIQEYNDGDIIINEKYETSISGNDWVIKVGGSTTKTITIKDAAEQSIWVNGEEIAPPATPKGWKFASGKAVASIASADNELDLNETYGNGITTVDGSKITKGVKIVGNDDSNSIKGGAGADTIGGGSGNDTVSLGGGADVYIYSGGEDLIQDYATVDAIQIDTLSVDITSFETVSSNIEITTSEGKITVKNGKGKDITLIDAEGDKIVLGPVPPAGWKFASGKASASIASADKAVDLNEYYGDGIATVDGSKITTGVSIVGNDVGNSIKGGKGADTIIGGSGDDVVSLGAGKDIYVYNGGNDIIQDYATGDTIQINISNFKEISSETSNTDVTITVDGETLTLKEASDKALTLIDDIGNPIVIKPTDTVITGTAKAEKLSNDADNATIDGLAGNDTITNNGDNVSISGGAGNDKITNTGNDVSIYGGAGADTITNEGENVSYFYNAGDGKDVIDGFGENDTLVIDKGYTYSVSGNDVVFKVNNSTASMITLKGASALSAIHVNDEIIELVNPPEGWVYGNTAKTILKASVAGAAKEIDLNESYGEGVVSVDGSTITAGVIITGHNEGNSIKGGKGDDYIIGGTGDDSVSLGAGADVYVYNGGDDLIQDYKAGDDTIQFVGIGADDFTTSVKGSDLIFLTNSGKVTIKNGNNAGNEVVIVDENDEQIYPVIIEPVPTGWKKDSSKSLLQASVSTAETEINLNEGYGDDVTKVDSSKITENVSITGNNLGVSIKAGAGDDTLTGGELNDTLTGGKGADIFVFSGGDDVITDYGTGADSIMVDTTEYPESILTFETIGTNYVITTKNNDKLTIKNGKSKDVIVMDEDGIQINLPPTKLPDGWTSDSTGKKLTATISSADDLDLTEDYGAGVKNVDASKTSAVSVLGNDLDNSIKGGKGKDTLDGGEGNDTLTGGDGADVFIFSGGTDVITDYVAGEDSIQINENTFIGVDTIGTNVIVSTSKGDLTVQKANNKTILIMNENGKVIYPKKPLPGGWEYDSTQKQVKALAGYPDDLDLNEEYGEGVERRYYYRRRI